VKEFGYWKGYPTDHYYQRHPAGFDFPNDGPQYVSRGIKLRYSIVHTGLFQAIQIRTYGWGGHEIKFNEIYDTPHMQDIKDAALHAGNPTQVLMLGVEDCDFHNNIVRDPGDSNARGVYVTSNKNGAIRIYNNLLYGNHENLLVRDSSGEVVAQNNSLYADNNNTLVMSNIGDKFLMQNNVLYQAGTGTCAQMLWSKADGLHDHNRYYFPKGKRGTELGEGESDGDPGWEATPTGAYDAKGCRPTAGLPGVDLSKLFTTDFYGRARSGWDMGACEFREDK
jgi:hypothetical protein